MVAWFDMHHAVNYILAFTDVSSAARSPNLSFSYGRGEASDDGHRGL